MKDDSSESSAPPPIDGVLLKSRDRGDGKKKKDLEGGIKHLQDTRELAHL